MSADSPVRGFTLDFLRLIGAEVREAHGVYTAAFPLGWKRRFGKERRFTFEPERRQAQVELVEAGSPFLKLMLVDAKTWGGVGAVASSRWPPDSLVFTFQFEAFSSLRKYTAFCHAVLPPDATAATVAMGPPDLEGAAAPGNRPPPSEDRVEALLPMVVPAVEPAGREFAAEAVRDSQDAFSKSIGRVQQYFQGLKHETFLEEARIRKRLGEIQSKLYFTEDGLRELKLQREQEKLTRELHELRQRNLQAEDTLRGDESGHLEKQRRRHEPKLRIRLVAVTLVAAPASPTDVVPAAASSRGPKAPAAAPAPSIGAGSEEPGPAAPQL